MAASGKGTVVDMDDCQAVLAAMEASYCRVVFDNEEMIQSHYQDKLNFSDFGLQWITRMLTVDRTIVVPRIVVRRNDTQPLSKTGFSIKNEDYKYYTRTAASDLCTDKVLISLDPHFSNNAQLLRKIYGIRVFTPAVFKTLPTHE